MSVKQTCGKGPRILLKIALPIDAPIGKPVTISAKPVIICPEVMAGKVSHHGWAQFGQPAVSNIITYLNGMDY